VSRKGDDSEGFDPHPGDPWHPEWSSGEEEDDLFTVPEPGEGEGRSGFFRRLLGAKDGRAAADGDSEGDSEDSSVEHLFDTIRTEPEPQPDAMPDDVPEAAQLPADAQDSALEDGAEDESVTSDVVTADAFAAAVNFEAETAVTADEAEWDFEDVDLLEQILEQEPPEELLVSLERFESLVENELAEVDEETLADELEAVAIGLERAARQTATASAALLEQRLDQDLARREAAQLNTEIAAATTAFEYAWSGEGARAARAFESRLLVQEEQRTAAAQRGILEDARRAMTSAAAAAAAARAERLQGLLAREAESFEIDLTAAEALAVDSEIADAVADEARTRAIVAAVGFQAHLRSSIHDEELSRLSGEIAQMQEAVTDERLRHRAAEEAAIAASWEASLSEVVDVDENDELLSELTAAVHSIDAERAATLPDIDAGSDDTATSLDAPASSVVGLEFVGEEAMAEEAVGLHSAADVSPIEEEVGEEREERTAAEGPVHGPSVDEVMPMAVGGRAASLLEPHAESALEEASPPARRSWWRRVFRRSSVGAAVLATDGAGGESTGDVVDDEDDHRETRKVGSPAVASGLMTDEPTADDQDEELPPEPKDVAGLPEEPRLIPADPDEGFDGWLDDDERTNEEVRAETEPSDEIDASAEIEPSEADGVADDAAAGATDDAESEIADWIAFTHGTVDEDGPTPSDDEALDSSPSEVVVAEQVADDVSGRTTDQSDDDETSEGEVGDDADPDVSDAGDGDSGHSDKGDGDGGGGGDDDHGDGSEEEEDEEEQDEEEQDEEEQDEEEQDEEEQDEEEQDEEEQDTSEFDLPEEDASDDTDEVPVGVGFAPSSRPTDDDFNLSDFDGEELWEDDAAGIAAAAATGFAEHDTEELTQERYVQGGTSDHADLAQAVAQAGAQDTEQVALSADIPGLESTVVGFDDVFEAEGTFAGTAKKSSSDLPVRIITAVLLVATFFAALLWRPALVFLAVAVFLLAAGEFYTALMQRGYQPLAIFGFIGILAASIGTTLWGVIAIPISVAITATLLLLFFGVVPGRRRPLTNFSVTILVLVWIGALGSFAFDIFGSDDYRTLVIAAVLAVAIVDIAQYFAGRAFGRHQLAPVVSPKKTIEGLIGGVVVALLIGAVLHFFPPFDLASGLAFGAIVAVFAPMGDLAVSTVKRSLDVKDMGTVLPGHGGLLDRIDGLMFVIPAAWVLFEWLGYL
jgi:phosphatidate cytidylyltransferase